MIKVVPVETRFVDSLWPEVEPLIAKGLKKSRGEYLPEDIYLALKKEYQHLLVTVENDVIIGACITEVIQYPRKKAMHVVLLGGARLNEWFEAVFEVVRQGAENIGADFIQTWGRKGFHKLKDRIGGKHTYDVFTVNL